MVSFEGAFIASDFSAVVALVEDWLGRPRVKARIIGDELVYQDETAYLVLPHVGRLRRPRNTDHCRRHRLW